MGRVLLFLLLPAGALAQSAPPAGTFTAGSIKFTIGGRIKLDAIHDFKPIGSTDFFDPRTIPIGAGDGTNTRLHARETRLQLGIESPAGDHPMRLYVEGDFYGSGNAFRLRHAYGSYGGLTAGQTWTTFMDDMGIPNTIDFETPTAYALARTALVRWTHRTSAGVAIEGAVEESDPEVLAPADVAGVSEKPMPDFVGRLRFLRPRGHAQVSGFAGTTRFRLADGDADDAAMWGMLASVRYRPVTKDAVYAQVAFGDGIGRYRGGVTAVIDASNQLRAVRAVGTMAGYEHFWSERFSSNVVYAIAVANDSEVPMQSNRRLDYASTNFLWWFVRDRAWAGVEYLYGRRELTSGDEESAHRVHVGIRFNVPG